MINDNEVLEGELPPLHITNRLDNQPTPKSKSNPRFKWCYR